MNRAPAPLHVPDFSLVPQDDRRSDVLPPLPSSQALLQAPLPDVRLLGHIPDASDAAFNRAEVTDSPARKLAETTERLVPMIDSFRRPKDSLAHWWQRFTGLALERELTYWHACTQLENSAAAGKCLALQVQGVAQALVKERQRATQEAQWLGQVVHRVPRAGLAHCGGSCGSGAHSHRGDTGSSQGSLWSIVAAAKSRTARQNYRHRHAGQTHCRHARAATFGAVNPAHDSPGADQ